MTRPHESAYPYVDCGGDAISLGLTKREYFAAMAFQGLLADSEVMGEALGIACTAVKFADALIDALNGETLPHGSPHRPLAEETKRGEHR